MHERVLLVERVKADIKTRLERRKTGCLCQSDNVVVIYSCQICDMLRERWRQLFINKFKHFVCHKKESLTVSSLRNAKNLEMDYSQVLCFLLLPFFYNHCSSCPSAPCWRHSWLASQSWPPLPHPSYRTSTSLISHPPPSVRPCVSEEARCAPNLSRWLLRNLSSHGSPISQYGLRHEHAMQLSKWDMRTSLLGSFWKRVLHS